MGPIAVDPGLLARNRTGGVPPLCIAEANVTLQVGGAASGHRGCPAHMCCSAHIRTAWGTICSLEATFEECGILA